MTDTALPETIVKTRPKERERTSVKRLPPYNVILENDDHHSCEFVVEVLCKALSYSVERSFQLMMEAHTSGRAIVWSGSKEVGELKVEQIRTFHQTKQPGAIALGPLGCYLEPAA